MYVITTDRAKLLLRMDLVGFWDLDMLHRFQADLQKAVATLPQPGSHLVLANALGTQPQSREVTAALFAFMEKFESKARRLAFVTDSAVLAMQARRLFDRPGFCIASSVEDAEAYLFDVD